MPKELDKSTIIGNKYNMLTVIDMYKKKITEKSRNRWHCDTVCDCGNKRTVLYDYMITNEETISCGCNRYKDGCEKMSSEMLGKRFGRLTVVEFDQERYDCDLRSYKDGETKKLNRYWKCRCECGSFVSISTGTLASGHTKSCGCYQKQQAREKNSEDLTGMRFGYLTVIDRDWGLSNNTKQEGGKIVKRAWWVCRCKCGNIMSTKAKYLKNGDTTSCGCRSTSVIQEKVEKYILNTGYKINKEYECTLIPQNPKTGYYLPFDIEIDSLRLIIEVHGIQHYELCGIHKMKAATVNTTPEENFMYQKIKDRYKSYVAWKNGYEYLAISYLDVENNSYENMINDKISEIIGGCYGIFR